MKIKNPVVKKLVEKYKAVSLLSGIGGVLGWDLNVNLPEKGGAIRGEQSAFISKLTTDIFLESEFKALLEAANEQKDLTLEEKAIVRNLNRAAKFYHQVPKEIIEQKARTTSEGYMSWAKAKQEDRFAIFLPDLKKLIELDQIIAGHLGYKDNPYDALLDLYEPHLTYAFCRKNLTPLQPELTKLIKKIQKSKGYTSDSSFTDGRLHYPIEYQKQLSTFIAKRMGYDLSRGRIDISPHPFTTDFGGRMDVRITTHYKEDDFRYSFTSTMHETGHALYEQNISSEFDQTPLEYGVSLGIHEALSRFWENLIGKNPHFLGFMTPLFQAFYPEQLKQTNEESLVKLLNQVKPSFIRTEADEVTYTLHIILRFEIENELINKKLKPENLPEAWREKMKKYLGVVPPTDREGVLQDMHWSGGAFGYFPAYALGNLYGAQLLAKMGKSIKVDQLLERGEMKPILDWLNKEVHQYGSLYFPDELIKVATNEPLNPQYFLDYLNQKYRSIYNLSA